MSLITALLVRTQRDPFWLTASTISTYGRIEDVISIDVDDQTFAAAVAQKWLDARSQPLTTHAVLTEQVSGATAGVDYQKGNLATVAGDSLRCVEIGYKMNAIGELDAAPGFESPYQQEVQDADRKLRRMVASAGGPSPSSAPTPETGSQIRRGKLEPREIDSWSYNAGEGTLPETFHWRPINEPVRIAGISVIADPSTASGESRWRLMINGEEALTTADFGSLPTDLVLASDGSVSAVEIYGHAVVVKGDSVGLKLISDGGHDNVSITMFGAEPR